MADYNTQEQFNFGSRVDTRGITTDGEVTLESYTGVSWVVADVLPTGSYEIFTRNKQLRITPTTTANYRIDEAD